MLKLFFLPVLCLKYFVPRLASSLLWISEVSLEFTKKKGVRLFFSVGKVSHTIQKN